MKPVSLLILALAALFLPTLAQNSPPSDTKKGEETSQQTELKQKALALLASVVEDAASLKLPENKVSVYAEVAVLLWQSDEKRARQLFRLTAEELNLLRNELEDDSPEDEFNFLEFRKRILRQAARFDVDLAFEMMKQTRLLEVEAAMNLETPAIQSNDTETSALTLQTALIKRKVLTEQQLESDLIAKSVENNHKRAFQLLSENNGNVSTHLLLALQKLREKDEKKTAEIANEALRKLLTNSFENRTAEYFLIYLSNAKADKKNKPLLVDENLLRELAGKIADLYLQLKEEPSGVFVHDLAMVQPTLEKFLPEKTAQKLREKRDTWRKSLPSEAQIFFQVEKYYGVDISADVSADKILADANNLPAAQQKQLYRMAFYRLAQAKDFARARQLVQTRFTAKEGEELTALVNTMEVEQFITQDNLLLAKDGLPRIRDKNTKVRLSVSAAKAYAAKNTKEDKAIALKLLDDAKRLVDITPESEDEIEPFLQLVGGYAAVEPDTAFKLITPVILTMNDLMQAGALVRRFIKDKQEFRKGEFILGTSDPEYKRFLASYQKDLRSLAIYDFERTNNLISKFTRPEAQISVRLYIAQSILQEKPIVEDEMLRITNDNGISIGTVLH